MSSTAAGGAQARHGARRRPPSGAARVPPAVIALLLAGGVTAARAPNVCQVRGPASRTVLEQDGPNHSDCGAMRVHEHQMALEHLGLCQAAVFGTVIGTANQTNGATSCFACLR